MRGHVTGVIFHLPMLASVVGMNMLKKTIALTMLLSLASCAPLTLAGNNLSGWLQPSWQQSSRHQSEKQQASVAPAANAFLADLTARDIASVQAEAMRVYRPHWQRIAARSRYVRQPLIQALKQHHAPIELQMIPVVESSYDPYARSEVGATGLWQLMPDTAADLRISSNAEFDGRRDIATSTAGAARFLLKQYARFGSWPLAFAAYHLGPSGVQRRIRRHPWHSGDGLNSLPLPPITKTYIRHILGLIALQQHGRIRFPEPYKTTTLDIRSPVDLQRLHADAGLPKNQLFRFNPQLVRMQYFQHRPKSLSLRVSQIRVKRITGIISANTSEQLNIRVLRGEQLRDISKRYRVSVIALKKANPRLATGIKHGMLLRIPVRDLSRARITGNPLVKPGPRILVQNMRARGDTLGG